jgi:hypothetical protein
MAWNKALMFVKATKEDIDHIIPDVLAKTNESLFFDDAISISMGRAMGVSFYSDWVILTDVQGREKDKKGLDILFDLKFDKYDLD